MIAYCTEEDLDVRYAVGCIKIKVETACLRSCCLGLEAVLKSGFIDF